MKKISYKLSTNVFLLQNHTIQRKAKNTNTQLLMIRFKNFDI